MSDDISCPLCGMSPAVVDTVLMNGETLALHAERLTAQLHVMHEDLEVHAADLHTRLRAAEQERDALRALVPILAGLIRREQE